MKLDLISTYKKVTIKRSRKRGINVTLVTIAIIIYGFNMIYMASVKVNLEDFSRYFIISVFSLMLLALIPLMIISIKRILDKRPGLIINEKGINDLVMGRFYEWNIIDCVKLTSQFRSPMVLSIYLIDSKKYIDNNTKGFDKFMLRLGSIQKETIFSYHKISPFRITTVWLDCTVFDLRDIVEDKFEEYKCLKAAQNYKSK